MLHWKTYWQEFGVLVGGVLPAAGPLESAKKVPEGWRRWKIQVEILHGIGVLCVGKLVRVDVHHGIGELVGVDALLGLYMWAFLASHVCYGLVVVDVLLACGVGLRLCPKCCAWKLQCCCWTGC